MGPDRKRLETVSEHSSDMWTLSQQSFEIGQETQSVMSLNYAKGKKMNLTPSLWLTTN